MARIARVVLPGYPHHVTQRGNRRQPVFFCEQDYRLYLSLMGRACKKALTAVWAYCLMPNHVHLVMVPDSEDGLRAALAESHRRYTCRINSRKGWQGHLWQERFHSFPMDESHLLAAVRYVELNPVRAGLVERAEDWDWSSAKAHLTGRNDKLVQVAPMLKCIPAWRDYLTAGDSTEQADTMRLHSRTGRPLGGDSFIAAAERISGRELRPRKRGPNHGG
jgi:putative transposase